MESFLGVFVSLLNRPAVPWLLAVGIVFFALGAAVVFAQRINALQRAIEPAIGDLRDIPVPDFVDRYEAFNQRVEDNGTLGHGWKKFSESLILPHDEKGEPIRATERPEAYFGETCLIASRLNLRLWQSVPNILVGMGLLFTFVGLIAALYFASEGVAAKDIAKTQESLGNLLHAATFKFVTSVAGLFSSLVFSWWEKHCLHRVQKVLDEFCRLLEERVVFTTPEQLAYEQIRETRKQTLQFERFNADFAVSIASNISEALDKCFAERLQHALDGLIQEIKALGERLGKIGEEGMRQLLDGFLKELKGGAGAEMNSLKVTLAELDANLRKTAEAIEKSGGIFSRQVEIGAQPLESATARFKESVEKLDDIVKEAQSSGQTMLEVRDELKNTSDSLESAADPLREAARNLREAADKVSAEKIGSQEVADELRNSIQQIKAISGMLGGLINNIGELIKKGRESIDGHLEKPQSWHSW